VNKAIWQLAERGRLEESREEVARKGGKEGLVATRKTRCSLRSKAYKKKKKKRNAPHREVDKLGGAFKGRRRRRNEGTVGKRRGKSRWKGVLQGHQNPGEVLYSAFQ